jgi:hypothetical protein
MEFRLNGTNAKLGSDYVKGWSISFWETTENIRMIIQLQIVRTETNKCKNPVLGGLY